MCFRLISQQHAHQERLARADCRGIPPAAWHGPGPPLTAVESPRPPGQGSQPSQGQGDARNRRHAQDLHRLTGDDLTAGGRSRPPGRCKSAFCLPARMLTTPSASPAFLLRCCAIGPLDDRSPGFGRTPCRPFTSKTHISNIHQKLATITSLFNSTHSDVFKAEAVRQWQPKGSFARCRADADFFGVVTRQRSFSSRSHAWILSSVDGRRCGTTVVSNFRRWWGRAEASCRRGGDAADAPPQPDDEGGEDSPAGKVRPAEEIVALGSAGRREKLVVGLGGAAGIGDAGEAFPTGRISLPSSTQDRRGRRSRRRSSLRGSCRRRGCVHRLGSGCGGRGGGAGQEHAEE